MRKNLAVLMFSLTVPAIVVLAQESRSRIRGSSTRDLPICLSDGSASRAGDCEAITLRSEREITVTLEAPDQGPQCLASVSTEYLQSNTLARVESTIETEGCAAAIGEHTVSARVVDDEGNTTSIEFSETWRHEANTPLVLEAEYPIGENVELRNLRVREVSCECIEEPVEAPEAIGNGDSE